jgi:Tol biopolymer transport system component
VPEIPGSDNLFSPRWSPDGRHIAAISRDTRNLRLLDVKSGTWTNLTHEEGAVIYPAWSADSKYIYFDNISSQNPAYRRIRVGQTTSEAVVDLKSLRRGISSHLGPWSGLTANDQPLFQQDLSTGEVHFLELAK